MASKGHEPKLRSAAYGRRSNILEERLASPTTDVETADQGRGTHHGAMDGLRAGCGSCCMCFSVDFEAEPGWSSSDNSKDVSSELVQWSISPSGEMPLPFTVDVLEERGVLLEAGRMQRRNMPTCVDSDSQENLTDQCGSNGMVKDRQPGVSGGVAQRALEFSSTGYDCTSGLATQGRVLQYSMYGCDPAEEMTGTRETHGLKSAAGGTDVDSGFVESWVREEQVPRPLTDGSLRDQTHEGVGTCRPDPLMPLIEELEGVQTSRQEEFVGLSSLGRIPSTRKSDVCVDTDVGGRAANFKATLGDYKGSLGSGVPEEVPEAPRPGLPEHASCGMSHAYFPGPADNIWVSPQNPKRVTLALPNQQANGGFVLVVPGDDRNTPTSSAQGMSQGPTVDSGEDTPEWPVQSACKPPQLGLGSQGSDSVRDSHPGPSLQESHCETSGQSKSLSFGRDVTVEFSGCQETNDTNVALRHQDALSATGSRMVRLQRPRRLDPCLHEARNAY